MKLLIAESTPWSMPAQGVERQLMYQLGHAQLPVVLVTVVMVTGEGGSQMLEQVLSCGLSRVVS